jgi:hypothetical protein
MRTSTSGLADRQRGHGDDQHPPLAEHVAEAPQDRRRHRGREQVTGQYPCHRLLADVQVAPDVRQYRDHQRLQHAESHRGSAEHREGQAG